MDSKQKLEKVFEYFVNNESAKAEELFKAYMIETAADIYQSVTETEEDIMELEREVPHNDMGDDLADEIDANKDEIASEEMMGEDSDELEDLDADENDDDLMDLEDVKDEISDVKDEVANLADHDAEQDDRFADLEASFEKIKNTEEGEHNVDFNADGVIGDEHAPEVTGAEGSEEPAELGAEDDVHETIEEAMELHAVKADMKDKTAKQASAVVPNTGANMKLGGQPVKTIDKGHKGFERENPSKKPGMVTKETNTVKDIKAALRKISVDTKDKSPKAGESPAMPKMKK